MSDYIDISNTKKKAYAMIELFYWGMVGPIFFHMTYF